MLLLGWIAIECSTWERSFVLLFTLLLFEFIVITGASDGIGKEFAFQLASKKLNIVLVSRTESKLKVLAEELRKDHHCRIHVPYSDELKKEAVN